MNMKESNSGPSIYNFIRRLPRRHSVVFLFTGVGGIFTTALDAVGLALVAPVIALIAGSTEDLTDSQVVEWTRTMMTWLNMDFRLSSLVFMILVITFLRSGLLLLQSWLTAWYVTRYEAELRDRGYRAVMTSGWPFYLRQRGGDLMNLVLEETNRAGGVFGVVNNGVIGLLNLMTYLVFALLISWELTVVTVIAIGGLVVIYGVLTRLARVLGRRLSEVNNDLFTEANEGLGGAKIFKSEGLESVTVNRFRDVTFRRARVQMLTALNAGMFAASAEIAFIGLLLGGLVLGTRIFDLPSTTVLVFALLFFRVYQRTRSFQATILTAASSLPAVSVVDNLTTQAEQSELPDGEIEFAGIHTGIEFRDVVFDYGTASPVLKGVSMNITTGSTVALVGPSGGGKTTIIDLTIGLLTPTKGDVFVDGISLRDYSRHSWRSGLAYVPQETILFHDTVFRNIAWGRNEATEADVQKVARMADADQFIRSLPEGYDTVIGERGTRLSGGQRQRISLARALLRRPHLLILDEATSELDTSAENRIQGTFDSISGDMTILMAAHRLSTIMSADQIVVIGEGTIVEYGTAEELLALGGAFSTLYEGLSTTEDL